MQAFAGAAGPPRPPSPSHQLLTHRPGPLVSVSASHLWATLRLAGSQPRVGVAEGTAPASSPLLVTVHTSSPLHCDHSSARPPRDPPRSSGEPTSSLPMVMVTHPEHSVIHWLASTGGCVLGYVEGGAERCVGRGGEWEACADTQPRTQEGGSRRLGLPGEKTGHHAKGGTDGSAGRGPATGCSPQLPLDKHSSFVQVESASSSAKWWLPL